MVWVSSVFGRRQILRDPRKKATEKLVLALSLVHQPPDLLPFSVGRNNWVPRESLGDRSGQRFIVSFCRCVGISHLVCFFVMLHNAGHYLVLWCHLCVLFGEMSVSVSNGFCVIP